MVFGGVWGGFVVAAGVAGFGVVWAGVETDTRRQAARSSAPDWVRMWGRALSRQGAVMSPTGLFLGLGTD
jgi:hypothetical protein